MFFNWLQAKTELVSGRARRPRTLANCFLETLPPIFFVTLLSSLTYYTLYLNPYSAGWHLTVAFIVGQILANWFCFVRYKSVVLASPKNFPGYLHRYPSMTSPDADRENQSLIQKMDDFANEWKECDMCDMHVPQRTHHCGHCRRCIYILDHHCYFLGHCVGRTNMRFFLVFCLYAAVGCALGISNLIHTMLYYRSLRDVHEAPYYILPFTILMFLVGKANSFEVLYVAMINFGLGACLSCTYLFGMGLCSVFTGKTPYEERKQIRLVRREGELFDEDKSLSDRFEDVFGECGLLHFVIPYVPFDKKPEAEVGYRRIITYNNDYILNGTIHSSETNLDYAP